jgi:hypothetical protein
MQNGAQGNVPQIRGRTVVANHSVGEQGKGVRTVESEGVCRLNPETAPAVCMVYKNQFTAVSARFFKGRKSARLRPENLGRILFDLGFLRILRRAQSLFRGMNCREYDTRRTKPEQARR